MILPIIDDMKSTTEIGLSMSQPIEYRLWQRGLIRLSK
ncbi:hypothetical protein BOVA208_1411 [Bacteroides ovatus]|nr:hypothetical protein BOVA208_1411 [Bacteroides ovatus]